MWAVALRLVAIGVVRRKSWHDAKRMLHHLGQPQVLGNNRLELPEQRCLEEDLDSVLSELERPASWLGVEVDQQSEAAQVVVVQSS